MWNNNHFGSNAGVFFGDPMFDEDLLAKMLQVFLRDSYLLAFGRDSHQLSTSRTERQGVNHSYCSNSLPTTIFRAAPNHHSIREVQRCQHQSHRRLGICYGSTSWRSSTRRRLFVGLVCSAIL